jgi:hypothetical protein
LLAAAVPASAQVTLQWKFRDGQKFYQSTTTTIKLVTKINGQETRQETEHTTVASYTVEKTGADGTVTLKQVIESLARKPMESTTTSPDFLKQMQGATFTITLNGDMQITKFDGYDALVKRLTADDPNAERVMRATLPEETLKRSAEEAFAFLPKQPLKVGDRWERRVDVALGAIGTLSATHIYRYEGPETVDGKVLQKISVEARISYTPPKPDAGVLPLQITRGTLRADKSQGTFWFDANAGRLAASEMHMHLSGTLDISSMGQQYSLSLDQDQTVNTKISDQNPNK